MALRNPNLIPLELLGMKRQAVSVGYYKKGKCELPYPPVRVRIEVTNKCNLRCVMCPTGLGDGKTETGFMDMDMFRKITSEVGDYPYPTWVILYLGGEPLLHKGLVEMIGIAKGKGLPCRLNTNGTLLNVENIDGLLHSGLDSIVFSFDDVSPREYEAMRRGAKYSRTLGKIRGFLERKKDLGLRYPLVSISSLKLRNDGNVASSWKTLSPSSDFKRLFAGYEIQNINCSWAHLWAGDFHNNSDYKYERKENRANVQCMFPWSDLTVNWKGQVVACCYDLKYDYVVGDVGKEALMELWNSEKMQGLRFLLLLGAYDAVNPCYSCSLVRGDIFPMRSI